MRRASTIPPTSKTATKAPLTAGGRTLNRPEEPVESSTLTSRSMLEISSPLDVKLRDKRALPRSTSSAGVSVTSTWMDSPTARPAMVFGSTLTVQSVRASSSSSSTTPERSASKGVLPSFRTTKISVRPSSLEMLCRTPGLSLSAVRLPKEDESTPTVMVSDASTKRPVFEALTLMRISNAEVEISACGGGISPNRTVFSSRGSR